MLTTINDDGGTCKFSHAGHEHARYRGYLIVRLASAHPSAQLGDDQLGLLAAVFVKKAQNARNA